MEQFSISQLSRYSGIKPHTIRIWEQRYNALSPNRSEGNTRYYDNSQLRRLLNIVSLMSSGYKISELCSMPDKKLFRLINESLQSYIAGDEATEYSISQLIAAGMTYNEAHFEKILSHCLLRYGLKESYLNVLYPMLVRIGLMWAGDSLPPAQEHFISNIIRQKLYTAIDSLPAAKPSANTWLLFLPENEFHEIGLLLANYLIRLSGQKVIYLGDNVPMESLIMAVRDTAAQNLLLFLVHNDLDEERIHYLQNLGNTFTSRKIHVVCDHRLSHLKLSKRINLLHSVNDLEKTLSPVAV